jgi:hypothetical protein
MEAHMPRKQKSTRNQQAGKPKPNLGQKEAELEKAGKEQMRHMGAKDARKAAQQHLSKRGSKI